MTEINRSNVTSDRADISQFVIHLTKDTKENGNPQSAFENFKSIVLDGKIEARGIHCYHARSIKNYLPSKVDECKVVCFSEAPLDQLSQLVRDVKGRKVKLKPYGIVFRRSFLISSGAQPAVYMNGYEGGDQLISAAKALYQEFKKGNNPEITKMIPYLNVMSKKYDFFWEREWRQLGDFSFDLKDVVCFILPDKGVDQLKALMAKHGVTYICPGWRYEHIISELAAQQTSTMQSKALLKKMREGEV